MRGKFKIYKSKSMAQKIRSDASMMRMRRIGNVRVVQRVLCVVCKNVVKRATANHGDCVMVNIIPDVCINHVLQG